MQPMQPMQPMQSMQPMPSTQSTQSMQSTPLVLEAAALAPRGGSACASPPEPAGSGALSTTLGDDRGSAASQAAVAPVAAPARLARPGSRADLERRLAAPQRHRLLHGYPMRPLMRRAAPGEGAGDVAIDPARRLIVGVLPHPFCNPKVEGCGFCTFAHERFQRGAAEHVVDAVVAEVRARLGRESALRDRAPDALYLGGGTANLTPPGALRRLGAALGTAFDLAGAEVTLEGAPIYFLANRQAQLDALESIPARHRRLSLGVQTFDPGWLARMGREAFGGADAVGAVVAAAHARGMTASCDLLVNLPGQPVEAMLDDVRAAEALGFDQISVYHLVLFEGLGTAWSQDPALLAARPSNEQAFASWLAVRAWLLEHGFVQTTLTNFERAALASTPRAFLYEQRSFEPERTDGVGFGPGGISTFTDRAGRHAVKVVNHEASGAYRAAVTAHGAPAERVFRYAARDLRLLHLTRSLPLGRADRAAYRASFGGDLVADFADEVAALADAGLVEVRPDALRLTARGIVFADSVAGLLAARRVAQLRERRRIAPEDPNAAAPAHMG